MNRGSGRDSAPHATTKLRRQNKLIMDHCMDVDCAPRRQLFETQGGRACYYDPATNVTQWKSPDRGRGGQMGPSQDARSVAERPHRGGGTTLVASSQIPPGQCCDTNKLASPENITQSPCRPWNRRSGLTRRTRAAGLCCAVLFSITLLHIATAYTCKQEFPHHCMLFSRPLPLVLFAW